MKLEDIKAMAETDLLIDKSNLTSASIDTPLMVNKYYNVLIEEARIYKILEGKLSQLYKEKYDYYLSLADPAVYVKKPWNRKVLKSDVDMYISSDQDYVDMNNKLETQKYKLKYLEEIIKQFNQRTFTIKNIIDNEKFKSGGF